jgi:hypothetical protein
VVPLKSLCKEATRATKKNISLAALRANRWNRRKAAQELKISYRLLIYKIPFEFSPQTFVAVSINSVCGLSCQPNTSSL